MSMLYTEFLTDQRPTCGDGRIEPDLCPAWFVSPSKAQRCAMLIFCSVFCYVIYAGLKPHVQPKHNIMAFCMRSHPFFGCLPGNDCGCQCPENEGLRYSEEYEQSFPSNPELFMCSYFGRGPLSDNSSCSAARLSDSRAISSFYFQVIAHVMSMIVSQKGTL